MASFKKTVRILFVVITLAACVYASSLYSKLSTIKREHRRLKALVGELEIRDPTKITVMRMPQRSAYPHFDQWKVYLPKKGNYGLFRIEWFETAASLPGRSTYIPILQTLDDMEVIDIGFGYVDVGGFVEQHMVHFSAGSSGSSGSQIVRARFDLASSIENTFIEQAAGESIAYLGDGPICLKAIYTPNGDDKSIGPRLIFGFYIAPHTHMWTDEELLKVTPSCTTAIGRKAAK